MYLFVQMCLLLESRKRKVLFHVKTISPNMEIDDPPDSLILKFYGFLNRGELHSNHIFSSFLTAMSQISSSPKSAPVRKILIFRACSLSSSPTSLHSVISLHHLIVQFRSSPVYDFQRL